MGAALSRSDLNQSFIVAVYSLLPPNHQGTLDPHMRRADPSTPGMRSPTADPFLAQSHQILRSPRLATRLLLVNVAYA